MFLYSMLCLIVVANFMIYESLLLQWPRDWHNFDISKMNAGKCHWHHKIRDNKSAWIIKYIQMSALYCSWLNAMVLSRRSVPSSSSMTTTMSEVIHLPQYSPYDEATLPPGQTSVFDVVILSGSRATLRPSITIYRSFRADLFARSSPKRANSCDASFWDNSETTTTVH